MPPVRPLPFPGDIEAVKWTCQSISVLDRIIGNDPLNTYYLFDCSWKGSMRLRMDDGGGMDFWIVFTDAGAVIKGYDNESPMATSYEMRPSLWPGLLESLPNEFRWLLHIEELNWPDTTFCFWRRSTDPSWFMDMINEYPVSQFPEIVGVPDGSADLLYILDGDPRTYWKWAQYYWGKPELADCLRWITYFYEHQPITIEAIHALNSSLSIEEVSEDLARIGYPNKHYEKRDQGNYHVTPSWGDSD